MGHPRVILRLYWVDLKSTWVRLGAILGNPGVILEQFWEDLEDTWVHIGCIFWNVGAIKKNLESILFNLG